MGFVSFVGRVLFVAAFLLSAYQEYAPLPLPAPLFSLSSCLLAVSFRSSPISTRFYPVKLEFGKFRLVPSRKKFLEDPFDRFNEFGTDGGPAAKALQPKFNVFVKNISSHLGVAVPHIELKHVIAATIALKGLGGLLFILSCSLGAYLLLLYLAFVTPIVHDFYNYDMEKAEFAQIFGKFTQDLALIGALLFFLGMKNSIPKRQAKKKAPKAKTN
ncbi:hypothetical protein C2845_PM01G03200 [Panicum miliaceum]|uniref:HR-like lesion-inducer n=1 Tax=Panicum miliaceum TaxID=4540 RepID=A0A3L6TE26_PANMI|nr:hypothetical protein C2845_PM01G03200 [Panicum miliaceum]